MAEFKDLGLSPHILSALEKKGYTQPTEIQEQAITPVLQGRDLIAISQTGSGKTAAFSVPLLHLIKESKRKLNPFHVRALVIVPTRELAMQVEESFKQYGKGLALSTMAIYGGHSRKQQVQKLAKGIQILVATPGRLVDLLEDDYVILDDLKYFVLDEADRMLDMGFKNDLDKVMDKLPSERQSLLFSATMPKPVEEIARRTLVNPHRIEIAPVHARHEGIRQMAYLVEEEMKADFLLKFLKDRHIKSIIVFVKTKSQANKLERYLKENHIKACAIHSDRDQRQRVYNLKEFQKGAMHVLVATDIAARGLDIDGVGYVLNFNLPQQIENYTHRIGRTGRGGRRGIAISYISPQEEGYFNRIQKELGLDIHIKRPTK
ncbi:DEAD/DEAH box helicase [Halobacteriovorax sp. BALOs_7]|uniref:DEAD/DEAH box helicase n=1 Tax=unclassified Halobacteriovorax TaxID=2639665 RepID=UPI000EA200FC|nr:DEAD/DEAH box helicase [Halobacteriovorax sp. BALOs_7]AYF45152.1 DEAD/DEAH box helicase [Halobacteriovorax sp. BALOs_7]